MLLFEQDLDRDIKYYTLQINNIIQTLSNHIDVFLNNNISIYKISFLFDSEEFKKAFEKEVIYDISKQIDHIIDELMSLITTRFNNQNRSSLEYINNRIKKYSNDMIGTIGSSSSSYTSSTFSSHSTTPYTSYSNTSTQYSTLTPSSTTTAKVIPLVPSSSSSSSSDTTSGTDILAKLRHDLTAASESFQPHKEIESVTKQLQESYYQTTGLQALSAVSLGTLVTAQLLDVTGIVFISTTALMSLFIVPRRQAQLR